MTHDDIIRLAQEAGIYYREIEDEFCEADKDGVPIKMMAEFAALVAAAERGRMIVEGWRHCAEGQRTTQYCGLLEDAVKAEREACAKLCEEIKCGMWEESKKHRETRLRDASDGAGVCTYAIRARGEP